MKTEEGEVLFFDELQIERLDEVARALMAVSDARIFLFDGAMGSGKTTLIKAMCRAIGSADEFSSPTYSIVNEYAYRGGKIYHFDLYRLKNTADLFDIGAEEYFDSGHYCLIEWPELAEELIEQPAVRVSIEMRDNHRFVSARRVDRNM